MRRMWSTLDVSHESDWLKLIAPLNMPSMFVTLETSHGSGWLKAGSPSCSLCSQRNTSSMSVTLDVSQSDSDESKSYASLKMWRMVVTLDVFHEERDWLKTYALSNMLSMLRTRVVFQLKRDELKLAAPWCTRGFVAAREWAVAGCSGEGGCAAR